MITWLKRAIFATLFLLSLGSIAYADYNRSKQWFNSQSEFGRSEIQKRLVFAGYYKGFIDGRFGSETYNALIDFEKDNGLQADGLLTDRDLNQLSGIYESRFRYFGFSEIIDPKTGFVGQIPRAILKDLTQTETGVFISDENNSVNFSTIIFDASKNSLGDVFYATMVLKESKNVIYSKLNEDFFVITGKDKDSDFYILLERNGLYHSGFILNWLDVPENIVGPMISYIASNAKYENPSVKPSFANKAVTNGETEEPRQFQPPTEPKQESAGRGLSTGSGFFVSTNGLILTNAHVVDSCDSINVVGHGSAELLRFSRNVDLAVILVETNKKVETAIFGSDVSPLGASLIAGGYPLSSLMNNEFKVAFGKVTGRRGLGGDDNLFSISLPIQPGNSGGPLVDSHGKVVGVISSKLDDTKMLEATGSTGANFSFAINGNVAKRFIAPFHIILENDVVDKLPEVFSDEKIVENIEKYTVQILCR